MAGLKKDYWKWRRVLWDGPAKDLSPGAFKTLEAIIECFNRARWPEECCISNARLMDMTHAAQSTVFDRRNELMNMGLIRIVKGHKAQAAVYRLVNLIPAGRNYPSYDSENDSGIPEHNKTIIKTGREESPPALAEVKAYWNDPRFINSDPEEFFDHYTNKGWGKDWRAQARNWERKQHNFDHLEQSKAVAQIEKDFSINIVAASAATAWVNRQYEAGQTLTAKEIKRIRPALQKVCSTGNDIAACFEEVDNLEAIWKLALSGN